MVTHGTEKIYSRGDKNTNSHLSHCQLGHSGMFTPWSMILLSDLNWRRWAGVRATVAWRARVYWLLHTWGANVTNSHATKLCSHLQVLISVPEDISQPISQPTMVVRIFSLQSSNNSFGTRPLKIGERVWEIHSNGLTTGVLLIGITIAFTCAFNGTATCSRRRKIERSGGKRSYWSIADGCQLQHRASIPKLQLHHRTVSVLSDWVLNI